MAVEVQRCICMQPLADEVQRCTLRSDPGACEEDWREAWRRGLATSLAKRIGEEEKKEEEEEEEKES